jgi:hypothetical protein
MLAAICPAPCAHPSTATGRDRAIHHPSAGSSVRKATLVDASRLAQALASAFQNDPVITWIFPDQQRHRAVLPAFMEFRLRNLAFPHDEVWMTAGGAAAAVWLPPPGRWQLSRPQRRRLLPPLVRFFGLRTASVLDALERIEEQHPRDPSHWYLFIFGTEQAAQGRGWARPCWPRCWPALTPTACLRIWSRRASGTSPCTAATASRSPARSRSRAAQGSGPCGASPALQQVITEVPVLVPTAGRPA